MRYSGIVADESRGHSGKPGQFAQFRAGDSRELDARKTGSIAASAGPSTIRAVPSGSIRAPSSTKFSAGQFFFGLPLPGRNITNLPAASPIAPAYATPPRGLHLTPRSTRQAPCRRRHGLRRHARRKPRQIGSRDMARPGWAKRQKIDRTAGNFTQRPAKAAVIFGEKRVDTRVTSEECAGFRAARPLLVKQIGNFAPVNRIAACDCPSVRRQNAPVRPLPSIRAYSPARDCDSSMQSPAAPASCKSDRPARREKSPAPAATDRSRSAPCPASLLDRLGHWFDDGYATSSMIGFANGPMIGLVNGSVLAPALDAGSAQTWILLGNPDRLPPQRSQDNAA